MVEPFYIYITLLHNYKNYILYIRVYRYKYKDTHMYFQNV